jgi:ribonuclease P protein component
MRRYLPLRRAGDFERLRRSGRRVATPTVTVYRAAGRPGDTSTLVGIAAGKELGSAVLRNRARRRVRAVLDRALTGDERLRVLVIVRPAAVSAPFARLERDLQEGLRAP